MRNEIRGNHQKTVPLNCNHAGKNNVNMIMMMMMMILIITVITITSNKNIIVTRDLQKPLPDLGYVLYEAR